jgi:hypothetical protein
VLGSERGPPDDIADDDRDDLAPLAREPPRL